jgi:hypothetical protein
MDFPRARRPAAGLSPARFRAGKYDFANGYGARRAGFNLPGYILYKFGAQVICKQKKPCIYSQQLYGITVFEIFRDNRL